MVIPRDMRIKPKLLSVLFLINVASTLAFSWHYYATQKRDILRGIDERLSAAAYAVSHIVPEQFHAKIEAKDSATREEYLHYVRLLTRYANEAGLAYLYSCMKLGNDIVFIADSIAIRDVKEGWDKDIPETYDTAPPALRLAFEDGKMHFSEYRDEYGSFRSVFIPLKAFNHKTYVVCADIRVDFVAERLRASFADTILIGVVIFLIAFVVEILLIDHIVKPLAQLTGYTRVLVAQDFKLEERVLASMEDISHARKGEVSDLANALHGMYTTLQRYIVDLRDTTAAREAVESELRIARAIQTSLLPRTFPPFPHHTEFALHAINVSAKQVAGDFFDFYLLPDDKLMITIADVSGKGVPAALLMAVTRTLLKNLALSGLQPAQIVEKANAVLVEDNEQGMFVTLFLAAYEPKTGRLCYANAGHNAPCRLDKEGVLREHLSTTGPIIGVVPGQTYTEREAWLAVGDSLVLYTDGVTEAHSPEGGLYGEERFQALVSLHAQDSPEQICSVVADAVADYQQGNTYDDITLLVLRRNR